MPLLELLLKDSSPASAILLGLLLSAVVLERVAHYYLSGARPRGPPQPELRQTYRENGRSHGKDLREPGPGHSEAGWHRGYATAHGQKLDAVNRHTSILVDRRTA